MQNLIPIIKYLPVALLWDLPTILMPFIICIISMLSLYTMLRKNYEQFYCFYKSLFFLSALGFCAYGIERLFLKEQFFMLQDFLIFFFYFFFFLFTLAFIAFVDTKKDTRYYIISTWIFLTFLICKFIYYSW